MSAQKLAPMDFKLSIRGDGKNDIIRAHFANLAGEKIADVGTLNMTIADRHPEVWVKWKAFLADVTDIVVHAATGEHPVQNEVSLHTTN